MFGELLRRLLWVPPLAVLISLLTFELVAEGPGARARGPSRYAHLPRFVNTQPDDAAAQARRALDQLRVADNEDASRALAHLGGAALPVALPALEGVTPAARGRVVHALRPVGRRMGHDPGEGDEGALWWRRFWEDRAGDFERSVVRRQVRRLGRHPTEGQLHEVQVLDTAALDDLFVAVGRDSEATEEGKRAALGEIRRLMGHDASATGATLAAILAAVDPDAELMDLRSRWFAHRLDYRILDGTDRAAALFSETQYGKWVLRSALGRSRALAERSTLTATRATAGATAGGLLAALVAAIAGARRRLARRALAALAALVPLGVVLLGDQPWSWLPLVALMVAPGASRRLGRVLDEAFVSATAVAARARGASHAAVARTALWRWGPGAVALGVAVDLGIGAAVVLVVEYRSDLMGLGQLLPAALREGDASVLMSLAVALAVAALGAAALGGTLEVRGDRVRGAG